MKVGMVVWLLKFSFQEFVVDPTAKGKKRGPPKKTVPAALPHSTVTPTPEGGAPADSLSTPPPAVGSTSNTPTAQQLVKVTN